MFRIPSIGIFLCTLGLLGCSQQERAPTDAETHDAIGSVLRRSIGASLAGFQLLDIQRGASQPATILQDGSRAIVYPLTFGVELKLVEGSDLKKMADKDSAILENEKTPKTHYFFRMKGRWVYTMHPDIDLKWTSSE
jgi:hypothetical protein